MILQLLHLLRAPCQQLVACLMTDSCKAGSKVWFASAAAQERHLLEVQQREGGLLSRIARLESQVSRFSRLPHSGFQTAFALSPASAQAGAAALATSAAASTSMTME